MILSGFMSIITCAISWFGICCCFHEYHKDEYKELEKENLVDKPPSYNESIYYDIYG